MTSLTSPASKRSRLPFLGRLAALYGHRGGGTNELAHLQEALRKVQGVLPGLDQQIATEYASCTHLLDPLASASDELVSESESLLRLAVGQTDGDLITEGTASLLEPPIKFLNQWRNEVVEGLRELEECGDVLAHLQGSESLLQALVSPLHYMQVMFRVEAARLAEDVRQVFAALTEQIAVVHNEVRTTFGQQFQIVASTLKSLQEITANIRKQANSLEKDLQTREHSISTSINALRNELEKNSERDVALSSTSRAVSSSIGEMVVALQSQDINTQRISHVLTALNEAEALLKECSSAHDEKANKAYYLLAIQRSQLAGVYTDLSSSELAIVNAIDNVERQAESLTGDCLVLSEFKEVTVGVNGSIQVSIDMVVDLRNLLEEVVSCSSQFYASIEPIGHLTTQLNGALEGLSNKMRLIALNAQVQAVQIGAGTGLEVLAAHIADVSGKTSSLAETISADISRLIATIQSLSVSLRAISDTGSQHLNSLRTTGHEHEHRLHEIRDRTLNKLIVVGAASDRIRELADSIKRQNGTRHAVLQTLKQIEQGLADNLQAVHTVFESRTAASPAVSTSFKYSMESERLAHANALQQLHSSVEEWNHQPPNADAASTAGQEPETFIELF